MPATIDLNTLITALQRAGGDEGIGYRHTSGGAPNQVYLHGPEGVLSYPGVDPQVFSTYVNTLPGLLSLLPRRTSIYGNPLYEVVTGITDAPGGQTEPDSECDDPRIGGLLKAGVVTAAFGRVARRTREISLERIGQFNDLADPDYLRLVGQIGMPSSFPNVPGDGLSPIANEYTKAIVERNVQIHRVLARMLWQGNPTGSDPSDEQPFRGLDSLITTGYVDAITNTALPSMDSDVKDFGGVRIDLNAEKIVEFMSYMARYLRVLADRTGVTPVDWAIVMREEAFWELTDVWPCAYLKGGCTVQDANGTVLNIDAGDQIERRDDMRRGRYLTIDGLRYNVVFDDGIAETETAPGIFQSDIYFVPLRAMGQDTLYLETFDWGNPSLTAFMQTGMYPDVRVIGPWMEQVARKNSCTWVSAIVRPRVVLRTPWLAGRITDVAYAPLQHTRQPFPDDPYFVNGGLTQRTGPSYYTQGD